MHLIHDLIAKVFFFPHSDKFFVNETKIVGNRNSYKPNVERKHWESLVQRYASRYHMLPAWRKYLCFAQRRLHACEQHCPRHRRMLNEKFLFFPRFRKISQILRNSFFLSLEVPRKHWAESLLRMNVKLRMHAFNVSLGNRETLKSV